MADQFVIGHDVGTGGCKSVISDTAGNMLASSFSSYEVSYPAPNWAEQDPEDWWRAVSSGTRRVVTESGVDPAKVIGMGFAGQMIGVIPVDGEGGPLRPAIIWLDSRADKQAERMIRLLGGERVMMLVAGALPSGKDVVCKLAWLKQNEPELFGETRYFLDTTGYLVGRATGNMVIDHTGAGGTGILVNKTRDWSRLLAKICGTPLEKMPPIKSSIDVAGNLRKEAAADMGLLPDTPVIAGMADIPGAATGSGALEEGNAHIYLGTSSWLCISVSRPRNLGKNGIVSVASPDPNMFIMIGESETAGMCLEWFAKQFSTSEERARTGDEMGIFEILSEEVEDVEPGSKRLIFTPWMYGERAPVTDTTLRASFVNLSLDHGRGHVLRSIYEGVAYNIRWLLDAVAKAGYTCNPVRAIGGGAKSDVWMQIVADATRRHVEAVENPQEAGAMGCALAVAVALGVLGDYKDIKKVVKVRKTFEPRAEPAGEYDRLYAGFRKLYPGLSKVCRDLNRESHQ